MDRQKALVIKTWRVELGCSWGRVVELAAIVWPDDPKRHGRELCIDAADALGEDPSVEPWN
jgi:hypothetical protein